MGIKLRHQNPPSTLAHNHIRHNDFFFAPLPWQQTSVYIMVMVNVYRVHVLRQKHPTKKPVLTKLVFHLKKMVWFRQYLV